MINLDDVEDGIKELERTARPVLSGAMITEYPAEDRRYDQPGYAPFWATAAALDMRLSLHTATRRQGKRAPNVLTSMDYTYRERHGEALCRFKDGMLPSDFFRRNFVLSFQEDAIGIRLRDVIGVDNMMWGSDYPHSESTFPQSRKILAEILEGVPEDEQTKIAAGNTARVYNFDVATLTVSA